MKRALTGMAVIASLTGSIGLAQAQQQPASPHTFTGNVGFYSQYIFRGLTQTNGKPAIQGGFDYSHASGFYAGTWGSNVSWLTDGAPPAYSSGGSLEWDIYGGYKWTLPNDFTLDLGTLYYLNPGDANTTALKGGNVLNPKADTWGKLTDSVLRMYPDLPQQKKLKKDLARIKQEGAERDWVRVQFHMKRGEKDAAAVYSEFIIQDYPDSPRAADARKLLLELGPDYSQGILPKPARKPASAPAAPYEARDSERSADEAQEPGRVHLSDDATPVPEEK